MVQPLMLMHDPQKATSRQLQLLYRCRNEADHDGEQHSYKVSTNQSNHRRPLAERISTQ